MELVELLDRIEQRFMQEDTQKDFEKEGSFRARLDEDPEIVTASPNFQAFSQRMANHGYQVKHAIELTRPAGTPPTTAKPTGVLRITRNE